MEMDQSHRSRHGPEEHATLVLEVAVAGSWDRNLAAAVQRVIRGGMAEGAGAIIFDLSHLTDLHAESAPTWLAARQSASERKPPPQVALSLPPTRRLARHLREVGAHRNLPTFSTVESARTWILAQREAATFRRVEVRPG
jgi:hypothetical protein